MHREILDWLKETKTKHPNLFEAAKVLEAGSLDINGSVREYFADDCEYVGVDAKQGKGVDWWGIFHEYKEKPVGYFNVVISTETLEHDPFWRITLAHMIEMIKPSGALVLSFAGPGRGPHGVKFWQDPDDPKIIRPEYHPLGPEADYYWNLKPEMLLYELFCLSGFKTVEYNAYREGADICVVAIEKYNQRPNYYNRGQVALLRKYEKTKL